MEDVTITLDDALAERARIAATARGSSLSGYVTQVLAEQLPLAEPARKMTQADAARAFLAGPRWELTDERGRLPSREEMYADRADQLFRRHERPPLREGHQSDGEV